MKPHLPTSLYKTLLGASLTSFLLPAANADDYIVSDEGIAISESLSLSGYEQVIVSDCKTSPEKWSYGGAIHTDQAKLTLTIENNQSVQLLRNTEENFFGGEGAAIGGVQTVELTSNKSVSIVGNSLDIEYWMANGAAMSTTNMSLKQNDTIIVQGNHARISKDCGCSMVSGGSLYANSLDISNNGAVSFIGNYCAYEGPDSVYGSFTTGGAIQSYSLSIAGNDSIEFIGNHVNDTSATGITRGGAIYCWGAFELSGNAHFRGNYEENAGTYQLRGLYISSSSTAKIKADGDEIILFEDSIYADGGIKMNTGTTGTIIFSGAHVVEDLGALIPNPETDEYYLEELENSFTSEIKGTLTLGGGTLRVEDGARLQVGGLTMANGATISVGTDAEFLLSEKDTTISSLTLGGGTITLGSADNHDATLTLGTLAVTADSVLNANLSMASGTIRFAADASVTMGCSVTIGDGVVIVLDDSVVAGLQNGTITNLQLFESAENVSIGNVIIQNTQGDSMDKGWVLTTDNNGNVIVTPEPATATLSLIALVCLSSFRRRK